MGRPRIYSLNEDYFNYIDDDDKAYILGFIYADGCINGNYLQITLSDKDVEILEHIKKMINYDGKIYNRYDEKKNKSYVTLSISSKIMTNSLIYLGVLRNKTYTSNKFPIYDKNLEWSFLRGFFDGDGSIYFNNYKGHNEYTVNFSGNLLVLSQLKKILLTYGISSSNVRYRRDNDESCMLDIRGNRNIEKFYNLMYSEKVFYLKRKKHIFDDFNNMLLKLNKRNVSDEVINKIAEYYLLNMKQSEIADILKMPQSSIRSIVQRLRKNGKLK